MPTPAAKTITRWPPPEGARVVGALGLGVLARQVDKPADGDPAERVFGLASPPAEQRPVSPRAGLRVGTRQADDRPHADGEPPDADAEQFGRQEVPQFVHENDEPQGNRYLDDA